MKARAFLGEELAAKHPELKLGAVKSAWSQVVAGTNVRLLCAYEDQGKAKTLRAVVYIDLSQRASLSSLELDVQE